jgi:DNA-binding NarL/FixJ family response regulator
MTVVGRGLSPPDGGVRWLRLWLPQNSLAALPPGPPVVIIVADDHQVVRGGFAGLLDSQPDFSIVGTASDGNEAVQTSRALKPDVVLMDVRMPVMDGIEATRLLAGPGAAGPHVPRVIILTTFSLDEYVYDALRAGASGFLLKDVTVERLFDAVRVVAAGEALLAPSVTRRLISKFAQLRPGGQFMHRACFRDRLQA